jgi:hypothetical protein
VRREKWEGRRGKRGLVRRGEVGKMGMMGTEMANGAEE